jgi:hypothetical protein
MTYNMKRSTLKSELDNWYRETMQVGVPTGKELCNFVRANG